MALGEVAAWAALALVIIMALPLALQGRRLARAEQRLRALGKGSGPGSDAMSLGDLIAGHGKQIESARSDIESLRSAVAELNVSVARTVQYIGLVRYNPFQETGGDQSFALALLDSRGDGVVVSSLHGRTATRFYAKPVKGSTSSLSLSEEEVQAIKQAMDSVPQKAQAKVSVPAARG
jgi:hypothetical protein